MKNIDDMKQIECCVNLNLGIDIRFIIFPEGKIFKLHWHDYMELVLVRNGSTFLKTDINDKPRMVKKGSVIIFPPKQLHELTSGPEGAELISLFFDIEALKNQTLSVKNFLNLLFDGKVNIPLISSEPKIITAIEELVDARESFNPIFIEGKAYQLIGILLEQSYINSKRNTSLKLLRIFDYIQDNFVNDISAKTICKEFGYTESHLCRLFKSHTNLSISLYIQIFRIEMAKKLLQETDDNINIIAEKCGFTDFSYFCKCFKKHVRLTPSEFRKIMSSRS